MSALQLAAIVALGAAFGCTRMFSLDLPWTIATGARILDEGAILRTTPWVWTFPDHPWLNDKWGFEVVVAAVARAGGATALAALQIAIGAGMGALLLALARRVAGGWRAAGIAALALTVMSYRVCVRAEWASYAGAAATLWLLPGICAKRRGHEAAFLALVPVVAACHLYWFLGPLVVLVAGAAGRSARTLAVGAAGVLAAAVSPFGFDNVLHPVRIALQLESTEMQGLITEMRRPFGAESAWQFQHVLALGVVLWGVAAFAAYARSRNWRDAAILAVWIPLCCTIDRNLALLGVIVPLIAAAPLEELAGATAARTAARTAAWAGWLGPLAFAGAAGGVEWFAAGREVGLGWKRDHFPARLVESLDPAWSRERYVNDFSLGAFLDLARGSSFVDGNTHGYPPEFLTYYVGIFSGRIPIAQVDADFPNDGWMLRHSARPPRGVISSLFVEGVYAPVRWDGVATLFKKTPDAAAADDLWRRWLQEAFLPRASAWYPSAADLSARLRDHPDGARIAAQANPWIAEVYDALAASFDAAGNAADAARARRCAARLRP